MNRIDEDGLCYLCGTGPRKAGELRCPACVQAVKDGKLCKPGAADRMVPGPKRLSGERVRAVKGKLKASPAKAPRAAQPDKALVPCRVKGCEWMGDRKKLNDHWWSVHWKPNA